ncbi:MAG: pyridoxal phosphate-dependent aminotransferase [Rhodobacteraceae bacterium]|nr:pyridoxal phosphate-dependent aminotransferase [Paracoccaceae bacterium]
MRLGARTAHILGGGDDGWAIYYRTREMVEAGERVLNLTIGEPDIRTDPAILRAMHESALAGNTGYTFGAGKRALREAVAARAEARTGVPTSWREVVITPGGQAALFAVHMVLLSEGDTGLYCDPYYATYPGTIRATGAAALAVPTRPEDDFAPTEAAIAAAARAAAGRARTLLINTPNNPAGTVYSRATLAGIGRAAAAHDLWIVSDEVYETQVWEGTHVSPRALPGLAPRTVVVGSMSKGHAMTGSRLGWVIGPQEVVEAVTTLATSTTYGVVPFIQDGALFALRQGAAFEAAVAAPFRRRRDLALALLAGSEAVRPVPPQGAMYLMLDIRATGLSGTAFAEALLARERIAVMPGESFGAAAAGHVRVAMTIADDAFAEAIRRLERFAADLARGGSADPRPRAAVSRPDG